MKRRFFLVTGAGSLALAQVAGLPAIASAATGRRLVANATLRKAAYHGGVPGGCYTHRSASRYSGYTLAYALYSNARSGHHG